MDDIKKTLEYKWGKLKKRAGLLYNCRLPFISRQAVLNALFVLKEDDDIPYYCEQEFGIIIPKDLSDFYFQYNGCRLFFGSLSIFGIQNHVENALKPFDLLYENQKCAIGSGYSSYRECPYFFFGSLGGDYNFAYKKDEMSIVYCVKAKEKDPEQQFDSFTSLWQHYFYSLLDEYDSNGRKRHPDEEYKGIPTLENITCKLIEKG